MGLRERAILLLEFGEQPHILDSNDRLVGEGLQKCDLCVGEPAAGAGYVDRSDRIAVT